MTNFNHAPALLRKAGDNQENKARTNHYRVLASLLLLPCNVALLYTTGLVYGAKLITDTVFPVQHISRK